MARRSKPMPVTFVTVRGQWPAGPFVKHAPSYVKPLAYLAGKLAELQVANGWTQRDIAEATDVNLATVNHLLAGKVIPDAATIAALETGLGDSFWHNPVG